MDGDKELLKGNTPTLVLAVLKDAPRHGYAIAREIERRSGNALQFKEGTLYPALHALEREGMIVGAWSKEAGGRERKVYDITPGGVAELDRRTRQWNTFANAIQQVITGVQPGDDHAGTASGTLSGTPAGTVGATPRTPRLGAPPNLRPEPTG